MQQLLKQHEVRLIFPSLNIKITMLSLIIMPSLLACSISTTSDYLSYNPTPVPTLPIPQIGDLQITPTAVATPYPTPSPTRQPISTDIPRQTNKYVPPVQQATDIGLGNVFTQRFGRYIQPGGDVPSTISWNFQLQDRVLPQVTFQDGVLIAATYNGRVYGIDANSGMELWTTNIGASILVPPETSDGIVFLVTTQGLYALDHFDGRVLWQKAISVSDVNDAVAYNQRAYVILHRNVLCFDLTSGEPLWKKGFQSNIFGAPVISRDNYLVMPLGNGLIMLDSKGKQIWKTQRVRPLPNATIVMGNKEVFVPADGNYITSVSLNNGKIGQQRHSELTPRDLMLYRSSLLAITVGNGETHILRYDLGSNGLQRDLKLRGIDYVSASLGGDRLYLVGKNDLYSINLPDLSVVWKYNLKGQAIGIPIVVRNSLYMMVDDKIVAFNKRKISNNLPEISPYYIRADDIGDVRERRLSFADIETAGAQFIDKFGHKGILFEMKIPDASGKSSSLSSVFAFDYTDDGQIDVYVFVSRKEAIMEMKMYGEKGDQFKVVNDALPFESAHGDVKVFVPLQPFLSPQDLEIPINWYAYTYVGGLPAQDFINNNGELFRLIPKGN